MNKLTNIEERLLNEVSGELLMTYTSNISKEVRLSGSDEELRAFQYAKNTLEEFGLTTELTFHKAYISIPIKAELLIGSEEMQAITHSMSKPAASLDAELVYVEELTTSSNVGNLQGKIIVTEGIAIPGDVANATTLGAKGIIFINADHTHEMIVSPVWGNPTPETISLLPTLAVVSVTVSEGTKIKEKIKKGDNRCTLTTEVETGFRSIPTLITNIISEHEPEKFVLLSGHIDSWHHGAMDNGSANAVMLEVARILSQHKDQLKRSLRIAFWSGHSHGRYAGSAFYCDNHWEEMTDHCVLHINIDSVGAKGATILTEASCMAETRDIAAMVIQDITGEEFEGSRFSRAGDQSFWGTGTPSLFMGLSEQPASDTPASKAFSKLFGTGKAGGFGWWWHTKEDTIDKIDEGNLVRDCKIYLLTLLRVVSAALIPVHQVKAVEEIERSLCEWKQKAGKHMNLSPSIERVSTLKNSIERLEQITQTAVRNTMETSFIINEGIMELSRILVPLNYVKNSIFNHDPALKQPSIPKLSEIEKLIAIPQASNEYHFIKTLLQRQLNEINYSLRKAIESVENTLTALEKTSNIDIAQKTLYV